VEIAEPCARAGDAAGGSDVAVGRERENEYGTALGDVHVLDSDGNSLSATACENQTAEKQNTKQCAKTLRRAPFCIHLLISISTPKNSYLPGSGARNFHPQFKDSSPPAVCVPYHRRFVRTSLRVPRSSAALLSAEGCQRRLRKGK
jgi:hypothetical protein